MNNANIIATNCKSLEVAAFMVAKSNGNINPILLGAKIAMIENLRTRLEKPRACDPLRRSCLDPR